PWSLCFFDRSWWRLRAGSPWRVRRLANEPLRGGAGGQEKAERGQDAEDRRHVALLRRRTSRDLAPDPSESGAGSPVPSEPGASAVPAPRRPEPEQRAQGRRHVDGRGGGAGGAAPDEPVPAADEERDRPGRRVAVVAGDRVAVPRRV